MKKVLSFLFLFSFSTLMIFSQQIPKRTLLLEINNITPEKMKKGSLVYDVNDYKREFIVSFIRNKLLLLATKAESEVLKERGFNFTILIEDTNSLNLYRRAIYGEKMKLPSFYHTYDKIIEEINDLAKKYPKLIKKFIIGQTMQEKRDIFAIKISNDVEEEQDKPGILLNGCLHSNELLGAEICMTVVHHLIKNYNKDPQVTDWLNSLEIFVVPVINVDGHYIVTNSIDPNWRKNTHDLNRNNILDSLDGVDLNRNFDFNWAFGGSGDLKSERYRGEFPFSESEAIAVRNLAENKKFLLSITYHSEGEVIYYPWNWFGRKAPNDILLTQISNGLASSIKTMKGDTCYKAEYGAGTVGQTYNWFYGRYGTFDFVIETGTGSQIFSEEEDISGIVNNNMNGVKYILNNAKGPGLTGHITDAKTGKPLQATVWIPSIETEDINRRTSDKKYGRFWRLLLPGEYDVIVIKEGYQTKVIKGVKVNKDGWTVLDIKMEPVQ
jgi:hypothetical protein